MVIEKELRVKKKLHLDPVGNKKCSETLGMAGP